MVALPQPGGCVCSGVRYSLKAAPLLAFALGIVLSVVCAIAVWLAAPRRVRAVAGRVASIR